jgi:DnaK suppressor protein
MARRDTLLRLRKTLLVRSANLRHQLSDELSNLHNFRAADSPGDSVDEAFETSGDEVSAQLAELDARELSQIERAVDSARRGTYGICQGGSAKCQKRIPLARLSALPHTTLCIHCERELETGPSGSNQPKKGNWDQGFNSDALTEDEHVSLSAMETSLSGKR